VLKLGLVVATSDPTISTLTLFSQTVPCPTRETQHTYQLRLAARPPPLHTSAGRCFPRIGSAVASVSPLSRSACNASQQPWDPAPCLSSTRWDDRRTLPAYQYPPRTILGPCRPGASPQASLLAQSASRRSVVAVVNFNSEEQFDCSSLLSSASDADSQREPP
jgi:hypothetical protein